MIKDLLLIVGIGVILHWYAYAIAYGIAKGLAKVKQVTNVYNHYKLDNKEE